MNSLADQLPPDIARLIHPDWRGNEIAYWQARDRLLEEYRGRWIGFADGAVVAVGTSPVAVFHEAEETGRHPFVTCVGREDEPNRIRRASFNYDSTYPGEPLPVLPVEFRAASGSAGILLDDTIVDTGADSSVIPWADCQRMQLVASQGRPIQMSGVAGGSAMSLMFRVWVYLDGQEYPCRLQADFVGSERILGRDVIEPDGDSVPGAVRRTRDRPLTRIAR